MAIIVTSWQQPFHRFRKTACTLIKSKVTFRRKYRNKYYIFRWAVPESLLKPIFTNGH